ncbi:hypothetical protein K435DRAFT_798767 [Dendrothele bispora CBS 962.96]|uniref:Uncharacterized protein n=1 Tax=Dendrothele bispora (strain CBS 962.96) TaxID=1314807 RepID=A0A4S8LYJ2_DENBC|nr:hypothetical protein K435DRAFT_798767 [Dendrothele bispora CBS 962.96]
MAAVSEQQESTGRPVRGTKQDALAKRVWVGAAKRGNARLDDNPAPSKKSKTVNLKGKKSSKQLQNKTVPSDIDDVNAQVPKNQAKVVRGQREQRTAQKRADVSQSETTVVQTRARSNRTTVVQDPIAYNEAQEDIDSGEDDTGNYDPENNITSAAGWKGKAWP